jgi:hypothetical protein
VQVTPGDTPAVITDAVTPEVTPAGVATGGSSSSSAAGLQPAAVGSATASAAEPAGEPVPKAAGGAGVGLTKEPKLMEAKGGEQQQQQQAGGQLVGRSATSPAGSPRKGGCLGTAGSYIRCRSAAVLSFHAATCWLQLVCGVQAS